MVLIEELMADAFVGESCKKLEYALPIRFCPTCCAAKSVFNPIHMLASCVCRISQRHERL